MRKVYQIKTLANVSKNTFVLTEEYYSAKANAIANYERLVRDMNAKISWVNRQPEERTTAFDNDMWLVLKTHEMM